MFACFATLAVGTTNAYAVTSSWNIDTNGQYTTDANWNNGISPEAADIAVFDRGSGVTYTVTFAQILGGDIVTDRLVVGSNTVTFNPGVGTPDYILDNTATTEADPILGFPVRGITIGADATDTAAVLISHLAVLEAVAATLGHSTGSSGTLTLDQNNDLLNITGGSTTDAELIIGRLGTGVLNVLAGADVTVNGVTGGMFPLPSGGVTLGRSSSGQGTANISGAGSTLDLNTAIIVGDAGTGTLNVTTGGHVEDLSGLVGNLAGSTGTATIDGAGSTWSNALLFIGEFGNGTFTITGGGVVDSPTASMAGQTSSVSTATVSGAGSTWNSTTALRVGNRGNATLSVTDGGHVNSGESSIGELAASQGTVTVSGAGSTWTNTSTLFVGNSGNGSLSITGGGHVTSSAPMFGTAGYIAREIGSTGAVTVDGGGSTWTNNGALIVGSRGDGTLNITAGGQVTSGTAFVGDDDTATGEVNIDGPASNWTSSGVLFVAWDGSATLNVTGGGELETSDASIGEQTGSTGAVLVDGPGSLWTVNGILVVGSMGQGTLTVQNGGMVEVDGNVNINPSSTATLQAAAIGGNVANSGNMHFRGNAQIGGSLTNAVDAQTLIHPVEPCCGMTLEVAGSVSNSGTFTMQVDSVEPCCGVTLEFGPGQTFTNNATGVVNLNGPADAGGGETIQSKHIIGGSLVNSGQMNVRTNAQVAGSLTTAVDSETLVDPASPCCGLTFDVAGPVANAGTFTVRNSLVPGSGSGGDDSGSGSSSHQDVTLKADGGFTNSGTFTMQVDSAQPCCNVELQLGVGQTLTNSATGVVNLDGPADAGGSQTIESKRVITGSVINQGQMNVRGNTQIEGSLTVAVDAETLVNPQEPCCSMKLEVAGPVSNSGTFDMMADSIEPCCNLTVAVAGETFTNNSSGIVRGTGVIDADVLNHGRLQPGHSPGILTIAGNYTQASDGRLVVDVAGTTAGSEYDQLAVGGEIMLDGVVEVIFDEGFVPQIGNRFQIITTVEPPGGKFAGASLPGLPEGMDWNILYGTNLVSLAITVPGDYNADGTVNAADYVVWRDALGQAVVLGTGADGDGSGTIDQEDYDFWVDNFGLTDGSGSSQTAVPEPVSRLLVGIGLLGLLACKRIDGRT